MYKKMVVALIFLGACCYSYSFRLHRKKDDKREDSGPLDELVIKTKFSSNGPFLKKGFGSSVDSSRFSEKWNDSIHSAEEGEGTPPLSP